MGVNVEAIWSYLGKRDFKMVLCSPPVLYPTVPSTGAFRGPRIPHHLLPLSYKYIVHASLAPKPHFFVAWSGLPNMPGRLGDFEVLSYKARARTCFIMRARPGWHCNLENEYIKYIFRFPSSLDPESPSQPSPDTS